MKPNRHLRDDRAPLPSTDNPPTRPRPASPRQSLPPEGRHPAGVSLRNCSDEESRPPCRTRHARAGTQPYHLAPARHPSSPSPSNRPATRPSRRPPGPRARSRTASRSGTASLSVTSLALPIASPPAPPRDGSALSGARARPHVTRPPESRPRRTGRRSGRLRRRGRARPRGPLPGAPGRRSQSGRTAPPSRSPNSRNTPSRPNGHAPNLLPEPAAVALEDDDDDEFGDNAIHDRYEEIKRGETHITELQQMTMPQLIRTRQGRGLAEYTGLKKQDLIFKILKERVKQNGLMFGEGTLEVLPDGFGFLRSPDYNYLPCPDDIYISPSQIRRFGLRTGAIVAGQIRPPKENERYFALLRVEAINYEDPDMLTQKVVFDDLTPLHPDQPAHAGDRTGRDQHAGDGPGHADRQGPARPDRRPAAHRQDDPAAEDRQQRPREPPRVLRHRPADRRAARGSDRHGAHGQGADRRGRQLDLRRAGLAARPGQRDGHREGQADGRVRHATW